MKKKLNIMCVMMLVLIIAGFAFFQYKKAVSPVIKKGILALSITLSLIVAFIGTAAWVTTYTDEPKSYAEVVGGINSTDLSYL